MLMIMVCSSSTSCGTSGSAAASASLIRSTEPISRISSRAGTCDRGRISWLPCPYAGGGSVWTSLTPARLAAWWARRPSGSPRATCGSSLALPSPRRAFHKSSRRRSLELDRDLADLVVLAERMADPVLGHQDPAGVGVSVEGDAEHVEHLTLHRLGAGVDVEEARDRRIGFGN